MTLTVATILAETGARVWRLNTDGSLEDGLGPRDLDGSLREVVVDSRRVEDGDLFVALAGERVDGNDFVASALQSGARACLVARIPSPAELASATAHRGAQAFLFLAEDPLLSLHSLARGWRRRQPAEIVGVTGSIGKTTTKEIMSSLLAAWWPVLRSEANLNTEIGLPLTLLRLRPEHQVAVLEMGMHYTGDISLLAHIAEPQVGVVTNVLPIHLERVNSIKLIAREKSSLIASLPVGGLAVLNADDPWTRAMAVSSGLAPYILVGEAPDSQYRVTDIHALGLLGTSFNLAVDGRVVSFRTQVPGAHTIPAFVAGIAVARRLGMEWDEIQNVATQVRFDVRQKILHPSPNIMLIDDRYNASPPSMLAALELLRQGPGKKIGVLGDMLELGPLEKSAHEEVGARAAQVVEWLVTRGERARWIADEARKHGLPADRVVSVDSNQSAAQEVLTILQDSDPRTMQEPTTTPEWSILLKGSRGMKMEEIVERLLEHYG